MIKTPVYFENHEIRDAKGRKVCTPWNNEIADQIISALNAQQPATQTRELVSDLLAHWEEYQEVGEDVKPLLDKAIKQTAARIEEPEKANRWIPVSERLPKEETKGSVLSKEVFVSDGRDVWKSKYTVSGEQWSYTNSPSSTFPITYWKPIILPVKAALGKEQKNERE